jgi:para-nitrobenzyl esterase
MIRWPRATAWMSAIAWGLAVVSPARAGQNGTPSAVPVIAPVVAVEAGALEGARLAGSDAVAQFLGIPYAAAPVGPLRWRPPQPAPHWSDIRKASSYGSPCPQLPATQWLPYIPPSEDCLFLNVWTPEARPGAGRPVLVYFHGGGNEVGYAQSTPLGPPFARRGIVVVSANYRLGPFGFLALPGLTAESAHHSSGNYGLLDQLAVLEWVQRNIRQFGGDPRHVTVMGQSAGGVDACLLMASPLAHGLFEGAIVQSGDCQGTLNADIRRVIRINDIDTTGEESGLRLQRDLGIRSGLGAVRHLRAIAADQLLRAWQKDPGLSFPAIVDGWIVPEQPAVAFAQGRQLHIPVLVGSNSNEATVFGLDLAKVADYRRHLRADMGKYHEDVFRAYPVAIDAQVPTRAIELESDEFAAEAWSLARSTAKAGASAYLYRFTYVDPGPRRVLGAHHGEELFLLSDDYPKDWVPSTRSQDLSALLQGYWVNFVRTGNPNFGGAPRWDAYDGGAPGFMELGEHVGAIAIPARIRTLDRILQATVAHAIANGVATNRFARH